MRKKVGFIVQYYTFRNDMRDFIEELSKSCDLVLFVEKHDEKNIPDLYEKRLITSRKISLFNRIWNLLYLLMGNLPESKKNYFDWKRRRIDTLPRKIDRIKESLLLYLQILLPSIIDFDTYIRHLQYNPIKIEDLDYFISFTDVNDPYIIAQIIKSRKKLYTYVYSWDHIAKYHKFSKKNITYLTWNEGIKDDLITLHKINPDNIKIVGSTQFTLIYNFYKNKCFYNNYPFKYIYLAATFGYRKVAQQEVLIIEHVSKVLNEIAPEIKILFRPYPLLKDWSIYDTLKQCSNIVFQEYGKQYNYMKSDAQSSSYTFSDNDILEKFNSIYHSCGLIHCGSTIGLEASYFDKPVIYLNYTNFDTGVKLSERSHISHSNSQRHLKKYLLLKEYENVVTDYHDLKKILEKLLNSPDKLLAYNKKLSSQTPVQSMSEFIDKLTKTIEISN